MAKPPTCCAPGGVPAPHHLLAGPGKAWSPARLPLAAQCWVGIGRREGGGGKLLRKSGRALSKAQRDKEPGTGEQTTAAWQGAPAASRIGCTAPAEAAEAAAGQFTARSSQPGPAERLHSAVKTLGKLSAAGAAVSTGCPQQTQLHRVPAVQPGLCNRHKYTNELHGRSPKFGFLQHDCSLLRLTQAAVKHQSHSCRCVAVASPPVHAVSHSVGCGPSTSHGGESPLQAPGKLRTELVGMGL